MRLLILTQKVDIYDPILGFFHRWIEEFSKHVEQVAVIALGVGKHELPANVRVFSLGKEQGVSRLKYVFSFYRLIWRERKNYDAVFVHMNQEYILLGGILWKILGKRIMLWRNHPAGSFLTQVAMMLSDKIFCTSKYSYTARSKKTSLMPVGVNTELFKKEGGVARSRASILFLARISPSKNPELLIEALHKLDENGISFTADFYGDALPQDKLYLDSLETKVKNYNLNSRVSFKDGVPNSETPHIYNTHSIFINSSPSGMYDKTIFEAMACETLVLTSNLNLKEEISGRYIFKEGDINNLTQKLEYLISLDSVTQSEYGKELRDYMSERHSLAILGKKLSEFFNGNICK